MTRLLSSPVMIIVSLVVAGVSVDQVTKELALTSLSPGQKVSVISDLLEFTLVRNPGAAFGTGTSLTVVFTILGLLVLALVSVLLIPRVHCRIWAVIVGLGTAGVGGNVIDRLLREPGFFRGHVVDFISLKYFAVFNVADIFLTCTAVLVVVVSLILKIDFHGQRDLA